MTTKIEVKNVKTFRAHDGQGWECAIYLDGKRVGFAVEDGWGGCLQFQEVSQTDMDALNAHAKTLPQWEGWEGKMIDMDIEIHLGDLVNNFLQARDAKKLLKAKVAFLKPDGNVYTMSSKQNGRDVSAQLYDIVRKKYPDSIIVNCLAFDAALELLKQHNAI